MFHSCSLARSCIHHDYPAFLLSLAVFFAESVDGVWQNIDFCVEQFHYIGTRIKCVTSMTGGPFLE